MGVDLFIVGLVMLVASGFAFTKRSQFTRGVVMLSSAVFPDAHPPTRAATVFVTIVLGGIVGAAIFMVASGILFETVWKT